MGKLVELTLRMGEWMGLEPYHTQNTDNFMITVIGIMYIYRVIIQGKV